MRSLRWRRLIELMGRLVDRRLLVRMGLLNSSFQTVVYMAKTAVQTAFGRRDGVDVSGVVRVWF